MKPPSLVAGFQKGLYGGRWTVKGTVFWLFGWVGVLGFVSQLPLKKKKKSHQIHVHSPANTKQFFFCRVCESEKVKVLVAQLYPNSVGTP